MLRHSLLGTVLADLISNVRSLYERANFFDGKENANEKQDLNFGNVICHRSHRSPD